MKAKAIIAMMTAKVKSVLQANAEQLNQPLTVENAERVVDVIQEAIFAAGAEGFKTWLQASARKNQDRMMRIEVTKDSRKNNMSRCFLTRNTRKDRNNGILRIPHFREFCVKKIL